jgi:hypothetical protein
MYCRPQLIMHGKLQFILGLCIVVVLSVTSFPLQVAEASNCLPLYNGGITSKQYCQSPTPYPGTNTGTSAVGQTSAHPTENGQKVYPSTNAKSTPDTGPADWSLPMLIIIGGIGLFLIKKTNIFA